jgi:hypothetical protein
MPFLFTDGLVMVLVWLVPILALWLPGQLSTPIFN